MGPLGELGALFNPGMRHELEERRSKAMRREEEGNARDGDQRIDLESGVVVINSGNGAARTVAGHRSSARSGQEELVAEPAEDTGEGATGPADEIGTDQGQEAPPAGNDGLSANGPAEAAPEGRKLAENVADQPAGQAVNRTSARETAGMNERTPSTAKAAKPAPVGKLSTSRRPTTKNRRAGS